MPALDLFAWGFVILWAILLWGGFFRSRRRGQATISRPWRVLSSLVLVLLAGYGTFLAVHPPHNRYAGLIALGMLIGFIGDLFMARLLPAPNRELMGMLAFSLGHTAYIAAILTYAPIHWAGPLLWLALAVLLGYWFILRGHKISAMRITALGYALFLALSAGSASGLAWHLPIFGGLALGTALFFISDLLIALELFTPHRLTLHNNLVWLLYGSGQLLIVLSIWSTFQIHLTL